MRVVGIDHVQLSMPAGREDDARAFYRDLLGLAEVLKPEPLAARGGCWFEGVATAVHLGIEDDFRPARKAHPAFAVANLDEAHAEVAAAGLETVPDDSLPGVRRFYTADPFGNRIEIIEPWTGAGGEGFEPPSGSRR